MDDGSIRKLTNDFDYKKEREKFIAIVKARMETEEKEFERLVYSDEEASKRAIEGIMDNISFGMENDPWYKKIWFEISCFASKIMDTPRKIYRKIKKFIQRGFRGWAEEDVWSLHYHLARIISESVHRLRLTSHGYPCVLKDEYEWDDILSKIEMAFSLAMYEDALIRFVDCKESPSGYKTARNEEMEKSIEEGMDLFKKYFFNLWD